jgi:hypothetical protein
MMELGLAYFVVATVVTLVVEQIRKLSDKIDGRLVNLLAWAVGFGATYVPIEAFAGVTALEDRLAAGLALAGLSSVVAEVKGALSNSRKISAEVLEEVGLKEEAWGGGNKPADTYRADEGYNPGETPGPPQV